MNRDELARLLGRYRSMVTKYALSGMPVAEAGGPGRQAKYLPSACVAWFVAQVEARYAGLEQINPQVERAKKDRAQAALARQLLERRSGELLEVADVGRTWSLIVLAVRSKLLALPNRITPQVLEAAAGGAAAIEAALRGEIRDILRELATEPLPTDSPETPPARPPRRKATA